MKRKLLWMLLLFSMLLFTGCEYPKLEEPEIEYHLVQENIYTLTDGTCVDLWNDEWGDTNYYRLADGTELLRERCSISPENVYVGGQESFDDLTAEAQKNVKTYYVKKGILYDIGEELEKRYSGYLTLQKQGKGYSKAFVDQSVAPAASNDKVMWFLTSVYIPVDVEANTGTDLYLCAAFDRITGDVIPSTDMFIIPKEGICDALLNKLPPGQETMRDEMKALFSLEYLVWFPDALHIIYPQGTLREDSSSIYTWKYEKLADIMQPWAIPEQEE
ncbi:MAG: hypothetical protein IJA90_11150 [Peptococcaceae bacterium]|nr:hypothetical protein [Peptococcaceae bacterium]